MLFGLRLYPLKVNPSFTEYRIEPSKTGTSDRHRKPVSPSLMIRVSLEVRQNKNRNPKAPVKEKLALFERDRKEVVREDRIVKVAQY